MWKNAIEIQSGRLRLPPYVTHPQRDKGSGPKSTRRPLCFSSSPQNIGLNYCAHGHAAAPGCRQIEGRARGAGAPRGERSARIARSTPATAWHAHAELRFKDPSNCTSSSSLHIQFKHAHTYVYIRHRLPGRGGAPRIRARRRSTGDGDTVSRSPSATSY